jgi:hypothetical protein
MDKVERIALLLSTYVHDQPDRRWTVSALHRRLASRDRATFVEAMARAVNEGWLALDDEGDARPGRRPENYRRSGLRGSLIDQVRARLTQLDANSDAPLG